jgi:hypothetical protein
MALVSVDKELEAFRRQIDLCTSLPAALRAYRRPGRPASGLPPHQLAQIGELACLRLFLAWETFLEETFVRYMCGARASSGYAPTRFVMPRAMEHARDMTEAGKQFAPWAHSPTVVARAALYFDHGEPYASALTPAQLELEDLRLIRNRIAHSSERSQEQFRTVVRRRLGYVPRGMGPGRFVLSAAPTGGTYLGYFGAILSDLADRVVR